MRKGKRARLGSAITILFLALTCLPGCQRQPPNRIRIFAAASTIDAVNEILQQIDFGETKVETNFASSASLAMLILQGVECDLFLSAHPEWTDKVQSEFNDTIRTDLLANQLVVIAHAESAIATDIDWTDLSNLKHESVRRIAIGDPESVPAGKYARQYLIDSNIWDRVESKVVAAADVRQALAMVQQSAAEAGIVYASDITGRDDIVVLKKIEGVPQPIVYPLLRLERDGQSRMVDDLFEFMRGESATEIFARHGFFPLEKQQ